MYQSVQLGPGPLGPPGISTKPGEQQKKKREAVALRHLRFLCAPIISAADTILSLNAGHLPPFLNSSEMTQKPSLPLGIVRMQITQIESFRSRTKTACLSINGAVPAIAALVPLSTRAPSQASTGEWVPQTPTTGEDAHSIVFKIDG